MALEKERRGRGRPPGHSGAAQREAAVVAILKGGPLTRNEVAGLMVLIHQAAGDGRLADLEEFQAMPARERKALDADVRARMERMPAPVLAYLRDASEEEFTKPRVYLALRRLKDRGDVVKCAVATGSDTAWMLKGQRCP